MPSKQVGILGFGNLGQYLTNNILANNQEIVSLAFIQNRSESKLNEAPEIISPYQKLSGNLDEAINSFLDGGRKVDVFVECSHPDIITKYGVTLLRSAPLFITSLTALADDGLLERLKRTSEEVGHAIFVPTGAGWGFDDIKKMAQLNLIKSASISMKFNADALRLNSPLKEELIAFSQSNTSAEIELFNGPVRELAKLAPNNVNTMCGLALAASSLGFDGVYGRLIAQKKDHFHEVKINIEGPDGFVVKALRKNPARPGAVTGSMTFASFWASLCQAARVDRAGLVFV